MAAALGAHHRNGRTGEVDHAEQIGLDLGAKIIGGDVLERLDMAEAGVVDQHIQPAKTAHGLGHGVPCLLFVGHVQFERGQVGAVLRLQLDEACDVACSGQHAT
uniref:Uncharacterized protein n=1 Tax=Steinernema glaseri TaxID=37863 RepID=A0A1I7Y3H1_9BILA